MLGVWVGACRSSPAPKHARKHETHPPLVKKRRKKKKKEKKKREGFVLIQTILVLFELA